MNAHANINRAASRSDDEAIEQRRRAIYDHVYAVEFARRWAAGAKSWEAGNLARSAAASAVEEWRG